ncbi:MAG: DUF3427 domain-containing protein [Acidimicrobiales bacterium]
MNDLREGLYDQLVDELLSTRLGALKTNRRGSETKPTESAELPSRVADVVRTWVHNALATVGSAQRPEAAVALAANVLDAIRSLHPDALEAEQELVDPLERLTAVAALTPDGSLASVARPLTPLRDTVLMTNARGEPSVGNEIAAEIESADRIDLVLAFIRWSGIRQLIPLLRRHVEAGKALRVITTTYTGSTELRAVEELADLGAEVKISYDTTSTRLHAKAWLFHRETGFSTVYIGSSNLTFSAQVTGLEWNVRASQVPNPDLISAFERTFATYWADPHFEAFRPEQFRRAVEKITTDDRDELLTPFDIEPYPFQRQILERLAVDRRRGHPHNLVVAATGTGKTVVAALDYRRLRRELSRARILFVAHRSEILEQARTTFRHVLKDGAFGELWVGGERPDRWDHVFASIQSLTAHDAQQIDPAHFDVVVVDEFHHSAADSYVALLDHVRPQHLLGLTATPERTDGLDVFRWFGGRISVELRLWDALEQGLLSPFHYFGIHDATDLTRVTWRGGTGYDLEELTNVYTADDFWVAKVIQEVRNKVGDPLAMRALGFCVSIRHAEFMADRFRRAGFNAAALTSRTSSEDRADALRRLRNGEIQVVFTVDLFNEGVDIPAADVILMLRPTESATIFLQQLGRGLRRSEGKDVLTVLDFVGHQSKDFRFDLRYRSLLGRTRRELEADVESGFPYLPAGCRVDLDPVAQEIVLANIRSALPTNWRDRIREAQTLGDVSLREFLQETGLDLDDIYRGNHTWTELRRAAGICDVPALEDEKAVGKGIARLLHVDDEERLETYRQLLSNPTAPRSHDLDERARRLLEGLILTVLTIRKGDYQSLDAAALDLWRHDGLRRELLEILPMLEDQISHLHEPLGVLGPVPLQVHATYTREEILAAFGASSVTSPLPLQAGVYLHEPTNTELLFVTLDKAEKEYSPTTRYLDYAISDSLFHWESQGNTSVDSKRGQSYLNHRALGRNIALFVRTTKKDTNGRTRPYFSAGLADYVEHRSDRPIQITWRLHHRLPGDVFADYRATVA